MADTLASIEYPYLIMVAGAALLATDFLVLFFVETARHDSKEASSRERVHGPGRDASWIKIKYDRALPVASRLLLGHP